MIHPDGTAGVSLEPSRFYRLVRTQRSDAMPCDRLRLECDGVVSPLTLPVIEGLTAVLKTRRGEGPVGFVSATLTPVAATVVETIGYLIWDRIFTGPNRRLSVAGGDVLAVGGKAARAVFARLRRQMRGDGLALEDGSLERHPELIDGWTAARHPPAPHKQAAPGGRRIGVVLHLYYLETLDEVAAILAALTTEVEVVVTIPPSHAAMSDDIRRRLGHAEIVVVDNRGRDVRPFLHLLESGRLDRYDYVLKLHGKRSKGGNAAAFLGDLWRRGCFLSLVGHQATVDRILARFDADPTLGLIGPRRYRYTAPRLPEAFLWGENRAMVLDLMRRMGRDDPAPRLDFFAGTMFWVRPQALHRLAGLHLADDDFAEEQGKVDGALEHAVERVLSRAVESAGFRVEETDAADF